MPAIAQSTLLKLGAMMHAMFRHGGVVLPGDSSDEDIKQTFGAMKSLSEKIMRHIDERMGRSYQLQQIVQLVELRADWACFVGSLHEDYSTLLLTAHREEVALFEAVEPGADALCVNARW